MSAMDATMRNEYKATDYIFAGIVRACCVCHPGETIFNSHPEWKDAGLEVSHGYCAEHREALMAEVMKMKEARRQALALAA